MVCRVFKKKNLFKVGNEGGGGGGHHHIGSDQLSTGSANQSQSHQRMMMMQRDNNSYMLHSQQALNYSHHHIPVAGPHLYTQIQPQNFIPSTNHRIIGYEFPAAANMMIPSESSSPPIMVVKQLMAARDCESGANNNCDSAGLEVGLTSSHQSLEEEQQNLNDWPGMIDHHHHRLVGNPNEETSKSHVRSTFEDANNTSTTSMTHMNQLSLRNEMDFWSYGK